MNKRLVFLPIMALLMLVCPMESWAQKITVTGKVTEKSTGDALPGATAILLSPKDSSQVTGAATNNSGNFTFSTKRAGKYILRISYMGFKAQTKDITLQRGKESVNLGTFAMEEDAKLMKEANVVARLAQVEMKADTFVYNADAYRMPEGSVLEELVKKLPGAEVDEDGKITINGKEVKKIMVDGKEFFANDTKMSMKNIPTKMVKNIKAYERQSDYSRVTGIDDGEEETVLDLTVKKGMKQGWLVDIEGGYGTKGRYTGRVNAMRILDNMQFAVFGNFDNSSNWGGIVSNQSGGANLAWENGKRDYEAGLLKVGGSIRANRSYRENTSKSNSETFLQGGSSTWSNSMNMNENLNWGVNADMRLEWMPDSMTNLIFRPSFSHSESRSESYNASVTFDGDPYKAGMEYPLEEFDSVDAENHRIYEEILVNSNVNESMSRNVNNNASASFQINRRLGKPGRNITLNANGNYSHSENKSWNISDIQYYKTKSNTYTNRYNDNPSTNYNINTRLSYTEPLNQYMNIQGSYQFQYRFSDSDRSMYDLHSLLEEHAELNGFIPLSKEDLYMGYIPGVDTLNWLLNRENSQYATYNEYNHDAQLLLRFTRKFENEQELRFNFGASFQPQTTHMDYKKNNLDTTVVRNVFNWAPRIHARWKINQGSQMRFRYNGRMSQPSMTNLLEIMDNSNPQYVSMGNSGLESSWTNSINLDYNAYLHEKQMGWAANASYSTTDRSVSTATIYDAETGNRYTRPMNIDGNWNTSAFLMFNTALDTAKHFSIHLTTNIRYNNNVGYISSPIDNLKTPETVEDMQALFKNAYDNSLLAKSTTKDFRLGENLRFNYRTEWGETGSIELALRGGFNYQHARNDNNTRANLDTWNFNYGGDLTITAPWGTTLSTDIGPQYRRGYTDENMNTTELIWNARLQHAFLKKRNLIVSAHWYDILGERSNVSRSISATMRSDTETNAINSYVMFKVAYKLNLLGGRSAQGPGGRRGPGGGWGGHGGGRPFRM